MTAVIDVVARAAELRQAQPIKVLRLYALVDGAHYQTLRGKPMPSHPSLFPLFSGTPDAGLAHAGPWLVDTLQAGEAFTADLAQLEKQAPAVTWLMASPDLRGLGQLLQMKLDTRLPDGRTALLRFWDPRVLLQLIEVLDPTQRAEFFAHIDEWHFLRDQQRVWMGRH